ncbi:hypothetical protein CDAR_412101 [Caerostris darwini]|uniref:Uncharacterized protein n=1 Tax=Caerostris darwini TaxID=1538125 RepID=A0AAV4WEW6_9ARAC|nr:hypothetical protein CDAR_412101 [Caerostris darwini]
MGTFSNKTKKNLSGLERFKLAPLLELQRTHKLYCCGRKCDAMEVGTKKIFDFQEIRSSCENSASGTTHFGKPILQPGHGGRRKMLHSLKSKSLIPTRFKEKESDQVLADLIIVWPIVSNDFNHRFS